MSSAPEDILFYFADRDMSVPDTLRALYENPSQTTVDHFLNVNSHIKNGYVMLGQMVIITPEDPMRCSIWEAELAKAALTVDAEQARLTAKERQILAQNYALLHNVAGHDGTGMVLGWPNTYFDQKKKHVERVLKQIEQLYRTTYDKTGGLKSSDFFAKRRALLLQVDTTINGLLERQLFGRDVHANRIKSQLGLSSKAIVHQWRTQGSSGSIQGFESNYRRLTNTARNFTRLGYLAIALDVGASAAAIGEACAIEPDGEYCRKTKYSETGRAAGSVGGGILGGWTGSYVACNLFLGAETVGTSMLWCAIGLGLIGGTVGGKAGSISGTWAGDTIYEKKHRIK